MLFVNKKNEVPIHATAQINLKNIVLSERRQTCKPYIMQVHFYEISKSCKSLETERKLMVV